MTFKPFKPMLAAEVDLDKLVYPVLASPKFDGIRCCVVGSQALSRNGKPIPNTRVRALLEKFAINRDGELVVGDPTSPNCFNLTTSAIMTRDFEADFRFYAFDIIGEPQTPFYQRLGKVHSGPRPDWLIPVIHEVIQNRAALEEYEARLVAEGWEGVMLRHPDGWYKYGRSTVREGGLLKMKRFKDAEAVVTGFEELMHNDNEAIDDKWGHARRPAHKENMRPGGTLGALIVDFDGVELRLGTGYTAVLRNKLWIERGLLIGKTVTFKYQEIGSKDAPRFPVFKGFRKDL